MKGSGRQQATERVQGQDFAHVVFLTPSIKSRLPTLQNLLTLPHQNLRLFPTNLLLSPLYGQPNLSHIIQIPNILLSDPLHHPLSNILLHLQKLPMFRPSSKQVFGRDKV